jgi:hypothetical protein
METAVTAAPPITDQNVYPLEVPNQPADPAGMNGCTPDGWRDQSAGLNVARWARGYLQFTVAAAGDPMILAAGVGVFTLFSKGIGESSSDANGLVYGENLDDTDTNCFTKGALCENNNVFAMRGMEICIQEPLFAATTAANQPRNYAAFLDAYIKKINRILLDAVTFDMKYGNGKNIEYQLGTLAEFPGSTGASGDVVRNGRSDVVLYTPLRGLNDTGGPEDNDKMRLIANVPQVVQIGNITATPTLAGNIFVPIKVRIYGTPKSQ